MQRATPCRTVGIIPARFASTRFPGKPLANILGKSLLQRTYENALKCVKLDAVAVATDDLKIAEHVRGFGGNLVMTAEHHPNGTERIAEALEILTKDPTTPFADADIIVNIQGDEPCLDPHLIEKLIEALILHPDAVVSTAVAPIYELADIDSRDTVKCVFDTRGSALYFSRQAIPGNKSGKLLKTGVYYRHIGLYAYRKNFLKLYPTLNPTALQQEEDLEQLKILEHGYRIQTIVLSGNNVESCSGVDTPEDIFKIEKFLCKQNSSSSQAESAPR